VFAPLPSFGVEGRVDPEWPPHADKVSVSPSADAMTRENLRMCLLKQRKTP
jgi:hypothetical protein